MNKTIIILVVLLFICRQSISFETLNFDQDDMRPEWKDHYSMDLEDHKLAKITAMSDSTNFNQILDNILIPRVVGSSCHQKVKQYLINSMSMLKWKVETDKFQDNTPNIKNLTFENVIATLNSNAKRFLILACHFDSKNFTDFKFEGASDSAVSCAMMIDLATVLAPYLEQNQYNTSKELSLKFIFFDGKEAFYNWTDTDSLYGSRHLAAKWENENFLSKIDMMMLLDLLGPPHPTFYSYSEDTVDWYKEIFSIEMQLNGLGLLEKHENSGVSLAVPPNIYFKEMARNDNIQDDHTPFLNRGVPILYIIPSDYPNTWHTEYDNRESIDMVTSIVAESNKEHFDPNYQYYEHKDYEKRLLPLQPQSESTPFIVDTGDRKLVDKSVVIFKPIEPEVFSKPLVPVKKVAHPGDQSFNGDVEVFNTSQPLEQFQKISAHEKRSHITHDDHYGNHPSLSSADSYYYPRWKVHPGWDYQNYYKPIPKNSLDATTPTTTPYGNRHYDHWDHPPPRTIPTDRPIAVSYSEQKNYGWYAPNPYRKYEPYSPIDDVHREMRDRDNKDREQERNNDSIRHHDLPARYYPWGYPREHPEQNKNSRTGGNYQSQNSQAVDYNRPNGYETYNSNIRFSPGDSDPKPDRPQNEKNYNENDKPRGYDNYFPSVTDSKSERAAEPVEVTSPSKNRTIYRRVINGTEYYYPWGFPADIESTTTTAAPPRWLPGQRPDYRPDYRPDHRPDHRPDYRPDHRPDYRPDNRPSSYNRTDYDSFGQRRNSNDRNSQPEYMYSNRRNATVNYGNGSGFTPNDWQYHRYYPIREGDTIDRPPIFVADDSYGGKPQPTTTPEPQRPPSPQPTSSNDCIHYDCTVSKYNYCDNDDHIIVKIIKFNPQPKVVAMNNNSQWKRCCESLGYEKKQTSSSQSSSSSSPSRGYNGERFQQMKAAPPQTSKQLSEKNETANSPEDKRQTLSEIPLDIMK